MCWPWSRRFTSAPLEIDLTMKQWIYFDNSATTELCPEAKAAMTEAMEVYGNPSSLHGAGQAAHALLEKARGQVASALGVRLTRPSELLFTASGTEANNQAIFGTVYAKPRRIGNRIVTTDCEHPSVAATMDRLAREGFEIVRIPTRGGVLDTEAAIRALETPTVLVSMMLVNNETGARFEVEKVFAAAKKKHPETVTHCDCVQGFLKVPFTPMSLKADLVTVSGHKIHGPKGVGALYVSPAVHKAKQLAPHLYGGGQESGLRAGTENLMGICGFGAACAAMTAHKQAHMDTMLSLRALLEAGLSEEDVILNVPAGQRAPHVLSITLPGIKSQTMLNHLSGKGICVSSGSACSARATHPSASLLAFGLTPEAADCTIRVSLCECNTEAEIHAFREALHEGLAHLVRIKRKTDG